MKKIKASSPAAPARVHLQAASQASEDALRRVFDAIALGRRNPSLAPSKAAKTSGTTLSTIRRYAPGVLEVRGGRTKFKPTDRLKRRMQLLTGRGPIVVTALDSRTASVIADHWNALREYIASGDDEELATLSRQFVHVEEGDFELLTHKPTINRLARAGALYFQDLYGNG
jgi:hypothetical protein